MKMVHNGIEYGVMAAYAEGLNILRHANVGSADTREAMPRRRRCDIPSSISMTSTSPRSPKSGGAAASFDRGCWIWRHNAPRFGSDARTLQRPRFRFGRGAVDDQRGDRRGRSRARAERGAL